nr:MAG TPA: hypothetical protein [Caudoviricetes sp.]
MQNFFSREVGCYILWVGALASLGTRVACSLWRDDLRAKLLGAVF